MSTDNQPIRFSLEFTPEIAKYIQESKNPTVYGFARRIKVNEATVWAWANKKLKDKDGNLTDKLARPSFRAALVELEELSKQRREDALNPKQEMFCRLYATNRVYFANATLSYAAAYELNIEDKKVYNTASMAGSRLMGNDKILKRINELLGAITNEEVDQELAYVIKQNDELSSKVAAIREWNKVKGRIVDKIDATSDGKPIAQVIGFTYVKPEQVDGANTTQDSTNA